MTKKEFKNWVETHDCELKIFEGSNRTGVCMKAINKRYPLAYYYLSLPFDERPMAHNQICDACTKLLIDTPPNIDCGEEEEDC